MEKRRVSSLSVNARKISGRVAPYDKPTTIGNYIEVIKSGAFSESLQNNPDIIALVDHNTERVLGRTKSGTLKLEERFDGLYFELTLPDTQDARDILALAERGDIGGMSFGFTVPQGGDTWQGNRRELRNVNLIEVSIVTSFPAYPDTHVNMRSRNLMRLRLLELAKD